MDPQLPPFGQGLERAASAGNTVEHIIQSIPVKAVRFTIRKAVCFRHTPFHKRVAMLPHTVRLIHRDTNILDNFMLLLYILKVSVDDPCLEPARTPAIPRAGPAHAPAAIATGASMEVRTVPGYMPINPVKDNSVVEEVFELVDPEHKHEVRHMKPGQLFGTTDFGDLSCIMPILQFITGGQCGSTHTIGFNRTDINEYYITPAKCFAMLAYRLLKNNVSVTSRTHGKWAGGMRE